MKAELEFNVINISCDRKHDLIFKQYDSLKVGDSFILVNDHDPKPLLNLFEEKKPTEFKYEYLVRGPDIWKLRFTKKMKESCCGCC